jgi:hypothetical protein
MSKRVCICVGVTNHTDPQLGQLNGAEVDAKSMFAALTDPSRGEHDPAQSVLLLDPTRQQISQKIADLAYGGDVDTFTFFFAGHGGVSNEAYALCGTDTNCDRFMATALPITEIFQILNDAKPRHSNIIIDACQAAGMVADLGSLLRPSQLGKAQSASISIFAASAADRPAGETDAGGIGTTYLLSCIDGTKDCKVSKEYLSLDDMGAAIDSEFGEQSPSMWSFNLSGASQFVINPKAVAVNDESFVSLAEFGASGLPSLNAKSMESLWRLYMDVTDEVDVRGLQGRLETVMSELEGSADQAGMLVGLSESFSARAATSDGSFASTQSLCAFLFAAQAIDDEAIRNDVITYLLAQVDRSLFNALEEISAALDEDFGLLAKGGAYAEFFSLPIRISQVAAWSLTSVFLAGDMEAEATSRRAAASSVLDRLKAQYAESFSLMSEEQAAYLFVISELAQRYGLSDWSEEYLSTLYSNYFTVKQRVAKTHLPPDKVFSFLRWRCGDDKIDGSQFTAKPTELLFVLLYHYAARNMMEVIRYDFQELDHTIVSTFVPAKYDHFSDQMIYDGSNIHFHIGFDLFIAKEYEDFLALHLAPAVESAAAGLDQEAIALALLASLNYPDRIPWLLRQLDQKSPDKSSDE